MRLLPLLPILLLAACSSKGDAPSVYIPTSGEILGQWAAIGGFEDRLGTRPAWVDSVASMLVLEDGESHLQPSALNGRALSIGTLAQLTGERVSYWWGPSSFPLPTAAYPYWVAYVNWRDGNGWQWQIAVGIEEGTPEPEFRVYGWDENLELAYLGVSDAAKMVTP